ncbi:MAG TPA: STAS domain-containing protein [Vicinamibacterales bacterium]|nr:STAS domain-containing protein [Vicinamibacterales bacterium]
MDVMHIGESTRDGWQVVAVTGRVDGLTAATLEGALTAAAGQHDRVAVDCSGIEYISSAGLRALLEGARVAQAANHTFTVCAPSPRVKHVFDISRMHLVLHITETLPC